MTVPERVTIYVCPKCGRKGWSTLGIPTGHWSAGARCGGKVEAVEYVRVKLASDEGEQR